MVVTPLADQARVPMVDMEAQSTEALRVAALVVLEMATAAPEAVGVATAVEAAAAAGTLVAAAAQVTHGEDPAAVGAATSILNMAVACLKVVVSAAPHHEPASLATSPTAPAVEEPVRTADPA
mmetsp:Transcript_35165/g.92016  ORF Transcript_35165/g.92016 Transcript_35165/m.92016 type:complete len:123 (+) Transcript_35165:1534-1902(+)